MFELEQVLGGTYTINCPARMGLWVQNEEAWLIDSGSDKDAGRRVRKLLDEKGWRLKAIVNTHSHADHIGGNAYLQNATGCKVYAPAEEAAFVRQPVLEPTLLYGGCPPKDLRHKFLMAQPSDAEDLNAGCLPDGFTIVPLPGHSPGQVGIRTPDDVLFVADCVSSEATLKKYGVTVLHDVAATLDTLDRLMETPAKLYIPAHAPAVKDISTLVSLNRSAVFNVVDAVLALCASPIVFDDLLAGIFTRYCLTMSVEQYVLVGSTIKSYLAHLRDTGRLEILCRDGRLYWQASAAGQ